MKSSMVGTGEVPSWARGPVKDTSILLLLPLSLSTIWNAYLIPVAEWTGEISFHLLRPSAKRSGFLSRPSCKSWVCNLTSGASNMADSRDVKSPDKLCPDSTTKS
jgi:hypothetical protein